MTRRTYYLSTEAADALEDAVSRVRAASGGRVTKAEALAALITAGADHADVVGAQLREALLRDLQQ
ncbi:hypothetical protein ACFY4C_41060 [Actinomadura viridis]|uniref:hypothetical protein n=1 Tax=Actinomadura viridis TaxID=58110 RepID=UPI00367DA58A